MTCDAKLGNRQQSDPCSKCVGATWVPAWSVNLTEAWSRVQRASGCFLKWSVEGYPASTIGFDTIGVCLEDACLP